MPCEFEVAPFVGVWIEICGGYKIRMFHGVSPFVGVWIEIGTKIAQLESINRSLPSWECGLKYITLRYIGVEQESLPSWECGLKLCS